MVFKALVNENLPAVGQHFEEVISFVLALETCSPTHHFLSDWTAHSMCFVPMVHMPLCGMHAMRNSGSCMEWIYPAWYDVLDSGGDRTAGTAL